MYLLREVSSARCLFVTALLSLAIVDHEACCYCTVDGTVKNWIGKCSQIGRNFSLHTSHCQGDGLRWMEATFGLLSPEGLLQNFTVASCGPVGSLISTMFHSKELSFGVQCLAFMSCVVCTFAGRLGWYTQRHVILVGHEKRKWTWHKTALKWIAVAILWHFILNGHLQKGLKELSRAIFWQAALLIQTFWKVQTVQHTRC